VDEDKGGDVYIVDRISGGWATLEAEEATFTVPSEWLPERTREGDVLRLDAERERGSATLRFSLDPAARQERERAIEDLRNSIPKGPEGDIVL
jgi:hypothetical protein